MKLRMHVDVHYKINFLQRPIDNVTICTGQFINVHFKDFHEKCSHLAIMNVSTAKTYPNDNILQPME